MKFCLITNEFYPRYGGIAKTFTSMCKTFKGRKEKLYIFNGSYKGKNIFDIFKGRLEKYNFKDVLILCKQKDFFLYFLRSIWKIISDVKVKFYFRLNMCLYLLIKPDILVRVVKNLLSLNPYIRKIKPDLILISACGKVIMPLGYILSRIIGKKCICWAHGDDFLVRSHYSLKTFYLKSVDQIILSCNKMKDLIRKINHLDDDRLKIVPRGLYFPDYVIKKSREDIRNELKIRSNDFVIVNVGRHAPRKNLQIVIKAMRKIKEISPELGIKCFLIGEGSEDQNLRNLTKRLKLEDEVLFVGSVNDATKNKYLKASDIFVMPSIASKSTIEGFGIVFLEANFFKTPVIGSTSGGIVEAIDHNKSGLLIKPNDLDELVKGILYFYDHEEERKIMGEYGYNRVVNNYNWELIINKYIKLFKETIKKYK